MSHVATVPHGVSGNLIFCDHGLSPYWAIGELLIQGFEGYSGGLELETNEKTWTVELSYQEGGIAPRPDDSIVKEYN